MNEILECANLKALELEMLCFSDVESMHILKNV